MILVVSGTGMLGMGTCGTLRAAGKPVRALVRASSDAGKVDALRQLGCEIAVGDLLDPASIEAACRGVSTVISSVSAVSDWAPPERSFDTIDQAAQCALIDTARAAGAEHFVFVSISPNMDLDSPLRNAKRATEKHLRQSGMTYTVLRPSYFMEFWLGPTVGFDYQNARATIYGTGHNPISWIAVDDVVQFIVASLEQPAARNATVEFGGPAAVSPLEAVTIFEEVGGRTFDVVHVPEEALAAQQAGATDDMQRSFAGLMRCYAAGDAIPINATLREWNLSLTSVEQYAERVLGVRAHTAG
jgi:uncharacterized protein YbjT (DUF2867 family)